ncbi:nicotinamide mononucleotide permease [Fusarium beomiforme]|uniref:Nicotinamide mononucleotide permease n=1 Tax=Fusarium beomiforme TaxID=44412 RepID=A0A9P5DRN6_9HYPO|nr:nicotinamide mononucleotide permease [Fusarium beomiforme]
MPTYLCHGFRWHRRDIRIFVILNDLEDAAPNWVIAPASSYCILDQLHAKYNFLPELSPPTTPTQKSVTAKNANIKKQSDHVDDDHALPSSRVPDAEDAVLMHSWSPVKLLEEFDEEEMVTACRPYAYVADYVVRVDLSVDVAAQMAKYYDKMAGEDGWVVKLRNELQKGEPVRWYVVVCGDDVREVPGKSYEEEKEVGYEQVRDAAQTMARTRRTKDALEGFSDSPSEYEDDIDRDEDEANALTVLGGILEGSDGAATPRPLSRELSDIDIPVQPQPETSRASVLTISTVWSQDGSPNGTAKRETPDIDAPLQPRDLKVKRISASTASSVWSRKESPDDGLALATPDVEMPLLHPDNIRDSTSTTSGVYPAYVQSRIEPEELIKAQSPVQCPMREEVPDVIQPLKLEELLPSRSSTPPTPKPLQRQLPAPTIYRPESFIPPFSPVLPSMEGFGQESPPLNVPNRMENAKKAQTSWPLSSDSPVGSSGSSIFHNEDSSYPYVASLIDSKDRLKAHLNLPKELVSSQTQSPTSEYSPQPQVFRSNVPKFEEIVPRAPPLLVSQNPACLEQPSSGMLYEAGDAISETSPTPRTPNAKHTVPLKINTKKAAKVLVPGPSTSVTTPTSAHGKTANPVLKTPPKNPTIQQPTQKSPKSRLPRSIPKNIQLPNVPLPPEPEVKTPRRPPTPPKPRAVQGASSQRRPQTAPEEGASSSKAHARMLSMPYQYEILKSLQELEREELVLEPTPSLASDYKAGVNSKPSAPRDLARGVRLRAPQPVANTTQNRQPSVSTEQSNGQAHEGGRHPKQRIARSHSVAEGLKKLFRKPPHVKSGHH